MLFPRCLRPRMRKAVDWGPRPHWLGGWATGITSESDSEQFVKMGAVGSGQNREVSGEREADTREGELGWRWGRRVRKEFGCEQMGFKMNKVPRL